MKKTYEDIRTHVLETAETKTNCQALVVGNLQKNKSKYKCLIIK